MAFTGTGTGIHNADDVFFNGLANADVMQYDITTQKWLNGPLDVSDAVVDGALAIAKVNGLQDALDAKVDNDSLADSTVDSVTQGVSRVGLMIGVAYNDGGSSWPSVPTELLNNPNVCIHWIGGSSTTPPPSSSGPAIWDALA